MKHEYQEFDTDGNKLKVGCVYRNKESSLLSIYTRINSTPTMLWLIHGTTAITGNTRPNARESYEYMCNLNKIMRECEKQLLARYDK